jgi:hypothetical protein
MADGRVRVVVSAVPGTAELLREWCTAEKARRAVLLEAVPALRLRGGGAERARIRVRRAAWTDRARERGLVLDTAGAVLAWGVRRELEVRGWDADWSPPEGVTDLPGRWYGSQGRGWPEHVAASLPVALVDQVRAACWETSREAITALREWRDDHPDPLPRRLPGGRPNPEMVVYEELAAQVTTPGQIWRAGLDHVLRPLPQPLFPPR